MDAPVVKLRILNEVSCIFVGLHGDHLEYFWNKYGVFAPNYFFNPTYQLGRWDGKIRYFNMSGKTYVYLLDDLLPRVAGLGYKIELEDLRTSTKVTPPPIQEDMFKHISHMETGEPIMLRDYQVPGLNALIDNGYGILVASTGSGKTISCAALCNAYGQLGINTLTIVPNRDLIGQTKREYINCGLDTGEYSGTIKTLEHQHVVSTWQALKNNPRIVELFEMVLVDECHGCKGKILGEILTEHSAKILYRFGVTGTMPKDPSDLMAVQVALGPVRFETTAISLIDRGVLANIHIDVVQLEENMEPEYEVYCKEKEATPEKPKTYIQFKDEYFPDFTSEKSHLQHNPDRIEWIAEFVKAKRDSKKGNVLCLVDSIALGRKLASLVPGAKFVNGQDVKKPEKRKEIYDLFKDSDDLVVFATTAIAGTGLNIPRIFNLITIDIGKSFIRVIQAIGRGLRKAHDKDSVLVTDICGDLKYSKKHLAVRVRYYKDAQYPHKKHKVNYNENKVGI
jgi:superfamily II DNA or RNA helicase